MFKPTVKGSGGKDATAGSKATSKPAPKDPGLPTNIALTKKAFNINQGCRQS